MLGTAALMLEVPLSFFGCSPNLSLHLPPSCSWEFYLGFTPFCHIFLQFGGDVQGGEGQCCACGAVCCELLWTIGARLGAEMGAV